MMTRLKSALIHLADMFDNHVLRHRFYGMCNLIAMSSWWPEDECGCFYCRGHREKWEKLEKELSEQ